MNNLLSESVEIPRGKISRGENVKLVMNLGDLILKFSLKRFKRLRSKKRKCDKYVKLNMCSRWLYCWIAE